MTEFAKFVEQLNGTPLSDWQRDLVNAIERGQTHVVQKGRLTGWSHFQKIVRAALDRDADLGPFSPGDRVEVLTNRYDPETTISQYWRPATMQRYGQYVCYVDYGNHVTRVDTSRIRGATT